MLAHFHTSSCIVLGCKWTMLFISGHENRFWYVIVWTYIDANIGLGDIHYEFPFTILHRNVHRFHEKSKRKAKEVPIQCAKEINWIQIEWLNGSHGQALEQRYHFGNSVHCHWTDGISRKQTLWTKLYVKITTGCQTL